MRSAKVLYKNNVVGILSQLDDGSYSFCYDDEYFEDENTHSIGLNLPKHTKEHHSEILFPQFSNMLSEAKNLNVQTRKLDIPKDDLFGLLLATAKYDTIGALTFEEINN